MEYVYAAMLLHKAGKTIDTEAVNKVLTAAGVTVDESRVKALVAALDGVNIDEAIEKAAMPVQVAAAPAAQQGGEEKKEKPKEEEKKTEEEAAQGLGALFG
ncbi:MAG: 50S ribosomal protein P1 [archaeon]